MPISRELFTSASYVRLLGSRRLEGEECSICGEKIFPPRDVCPECCTATTGLKVDIPLVGPVLLIEPGNTRIEELFPNLAIEETKVVADDYSI